MEMKICYCIQALIVIVITVVTYGQGPCPLTYRCRHGYRCAMVRHGNGPPVPDCITIEEALLLKQAFLGGPTGPGTGFGERRSFPSHPRWRDPRILHHPGPGIIGGANIGVPGVIPVPGGGHIHVPVPNSVRDKSERINLNLTIHNNNENVHDQRGSGRVTVIQDAAPDCTPCGPQGECPPGQHCMWKDGCPNNVGCRVFP